MDAFLSLYFSRYPYNWRTPSAYFFNLIAICIQLHYMYLVYLIFTCFFLGVCTFFIAFSDDLTFILSLLEKEAQIFIKEANYKSLQKMNALVHAYVSFHGDVIQLVNEWDILCRPLLVVLFYGGGLMWCICLFDLSTVRKMCNFFFLKVQ